MSRKRIGLQLEKSTTAGSIVRTNASNEQEYVAPGANGSVWTVVAGVPQYQAIPYPSELEVVANEAARPTTGLTDVIYIATAENTLSYWTGSAYVKVPTTPSITLAGNSGANQTILNGGTLSVLASLGFTVVASNTGIVTVTPPAGVLTGNVMTWNGTAWVSQTPVSSTFTVAGNLGTSQTISGGDTLIVRGATNSGIKITGVATDVLEISTTIVRQKFSPATAATIVTLSATPVLATLQVFRNGDLQDITDDYTVAGAVITFTTAFGSSAGGTLSEIVNVIYYTA